MAIIRHELKQILSNAVEGAGLVYTAGIVAHDLTQDVKGQTRQVLAEIDRLLKLAGTDKTRILSASIWVPDIRLRTAMNEAWLEWADPKHLPARACVEAKLADPKVQVEIAVVAAK